MANGLIIDLSDFEKLNQKEQIRIIFQNTEELKKMVGGFKFQQKVQWVSISVLFLIAGFSKYFGVL